MDNLFIHRATAFTAATATADQRCNQKQGNNSNNNFFHFSDFELIHKYNV